jgi:hypothetical protein
MPMDKGSFKIGEDVMEYDLLISSLSCDVTSVRYWPDSY